MYKPFSVFIGLRYLRAKRDNHFISFISFISVAGIAIGVWALITVISVMNGFEKELTQRILGMASHATISRFGGNVENADALIAQVQKNPDVLAAAPYTEAEVMIYQGQRVSGSLVRGIQPEQEIFVSEISDKIVQGNLYDLKAGEYKIILGKELATSLGVQVGDKVSIVSPQVSITAVGALPRMKRFTVAGIFQVGMYEYDRSMMFTHIADIATLLRHNTGDVGGIRLKLAEMDNARTVANTISADIGINYWVNDWTRRHANFFNAIQTERRVMFIILTIILIVASMNIVSTMIMVVTDKQSDIAILRTIGASPNSIMAIFIVQGTVIGLFGAVLGMIIGVLTALNVEEIVTFIETLLGMKFLAPDIYYISDIPSDLHWQDVWVTGCLAFIVSIFATLYPAYRAARVQPAEALRYE